MFPSATILPCHPLDNPAHLDYYVEHKFYTYSTPIRGYTPLTSYFVVRTSYFTQRPDRGGERHG
jgi:hypothetical protein